jgi:hypothetical protein
MTLFETPVVRPLMRWLALAYCWLGGWKIRSETPEARKRPKKMQSWSPADQLSVLP